MASGQSHDDGSSQCNTPRMTKAKVRVRFIKKENGQLSYVYTGTIHTLIDGKRVEKASHKVNGWLEYTVRVPDGKELIIQVEKNSINCVVNKAIPFDQSKTTTHEVDDQNIVKVTIEWENIEDISNLTLKDDIEVLRRPVEVKTESGHLTVVYTIGDAMSFTEFITVLRRILADHQDREDILDKFSINLCASRQHPVLAKSHGELSYWLHVKLQVVGKGKETWWTTLIMKVDNLYVCGFMDQNKILYRLVDSDPKSVAMIPDNHVPDKTTIDLVWTVSYISLLGVDGLGIEAIEEHKTEVVHKLTDAGLGHEFAMKAVCRLSSLGDNPDAAVDGMSGKLALGGLIVLVCESARMNPLCDSFACGWITGDGFKEELMRKYVWRHYYGKTSSKLVKWKSKNYANLNTAPIPQLQTMHLVLNATTPSEKIEESGISKPVGNNNGDPDPAGSSDKPTFPSQDKNHSRNNGKRTRNNHKNKGKRTHNNSRGGVQGQCKKARNNDSPDGPAGKSEEAGGGSSTARQPREVDPDSSGGSASQTEEDDDGGPSQPSEVDNSDQTSGEDGDHNTKGNTGETDKTVGHGRPLVELLAVQADLGVVGKKIIVFDTKRGQIIYSRTKEEEQAGQMVDLVLTGPYRGISAYGSFTIKVDIQNAEPARLEWDGYLPSNADEVDAVKSSCRDIVKSPDNPEVVAKVTYAVMSNALEATVQQVMLRLKDSRIHIGVHGEIKARIHDFDEGSILFKRTQGERQCFSRDDGDSWFPLQLARTVVAVPCGKVLLIEVDLKIETSNGILEEKETSNGLEPLKVVLEFRNGTLSRTSSPKDKDDEVKVDISWYPEISRPSHPPEQTSEEMGEQKSILPSHPPGHEPEKTSVGIGEDEASQKWENLVIDSGKLLGMRKDDLRKQRHPNADANKAAQKIQELNTQAEKQTDSTEDCVTSVSLGSSHPAETETSTARQGHRAKQTGEEERTSAESSHQEEVKVISRNVLEVTVPIKDVETFVRSITTIRRILAKHPDSGDILDSLPFTLKEHPLLCRNLRAMWLRIKLQVAGEEGMSSATLIVQYNNLYCLGFMNQHQVCHELSNPDGWKLPSTFNAEPLDWGITYESILNVRDEEIEGELDSMRLGKTFAADAVRVLSRFSHEADGDDASARRALAGLNVMLCESAKMNPLHKTIADGWETGAGFTERLMAYIGHWELISIALLDWKDKRYGRWTMNPKLAEITGVKGPADALDVIHLVRNFTVKERELLRVVIYES